MRPWILFPLLAGLCGTPGAVALAQTANPAFDTAKSAYDAVGAEQIAVIQRLLILTGDLNAIASGEFGKRSFEAIRSFQKKIKAPDTGFLLPAEQAALQKAADKAAAVYGFKPVTDQGITVLVPGKLTTRRSEGKHGIKLAAPDDKVTVDFLTYPTDEESYDSLFERLKKERAGRTIAYAVSKPDFFVIAGTSDGKSFYMRFVNTVTGTKGFLIGWDPKLSPDFDRAPIVMASSLKVEGQATAAAGDAAAKPADAAAEPAKPEKTGPALPLPPGMKAGVRTGIGVVVSAAGDVVTNASLVAGCSDVAVAGGGTARVIGGDFGNDIAVVRLASLEGRVPVALRTAPIAADEPASLSLYAEGATKSFAGKISAITGPGQDRRRYSVSFAGPAAAGAILDGKGLYLGPVVTYDPPGGAAGDQTAVALQTRFLVPFLRSYGVTPVSEGIFGEKSTIVVTCDKVQG